MNTYTLADPESGGRQSTEHLKCSVVRPRPSKRLCMYVFFMIILQKKEKKSTYVFMNSTSNSGLKKTQRD